MKIGILTSTEIGISIKFVISKRRSVWRILWDDKSVCAESFTGIPSENVTLDKDLVIGTRVDGLVTEILVVVVVEMLVSESACVSASTQVSEIVVVVCQVEIAIVNSTEFVIISYQRAFVMIVEVVP